jgi:hypothetical protein
VGRVTMSGPGAGGPSTSSAVLADVLVLAYNSLASTWEQLPPAPRVEVADDLATERGWLVTIEGLGAAALPEPLRELMLATTDEAFVTKPTSLAALNARLGFSEWPMVIYPILMDV